MRPVQFRPDQEMGVTLVYLQRPFSGSGHRKRKKIWNPQDAGTLCSQVLTPPLGEHGLIVARYRSGSHLDHPRHGAAGYPTGVVTAPGRTATVAFVGGLISGYGTVTSTDGGDSGARRQPRRKYLLEAIPKQG